MENGGYLFAAYTLVWGGVLAYVLFLSAQQARLRQEINALKQGLKEKEAR